MFPKFVIPFRFAFLVILRNLQNSVLCRPTKNSAVGRSNRPPEAVFFSLERSYRLFEPARLRFGPQIDHSSLVHFVGWQFELASELQGTRTSHSRVFGLLGRSKVAASAVEPPINARTQWIGSVGVVGCLLGRLASLAEALG